MARTKANTRWAAECISNIKQSVRMLVEEILPNDPTLGDNGVAELVVQIENAAEGIVLKWEKANVTSL